MKDRVSGRAYPGHGPVIDNATTKITEYIKHRQQREDEVLRVLRYGESDEEAVAGRSTPDRVRDWTPMDIVKVIYRDVPESLHVAASRGVTQVLSKLEQEGRVRHDPSSGTWRLNVGQPAL